MGFTYSEVVENGLMDEEVLENIPSTCNDEYGCGAELEFTDNLTQLYCPNRYCTHKIAARLEAMAKKMKADGWGESTCLAVVKYFKLKSPAMIFIVGDRGFSCPTVSAFEKKINSICDVEKRRVELWKIVEYLGIPGVASNAMKIFNGFSSLEEAYEAIEEGKLGFISERLGLKLSADSGILAVNTYETLIEYKDEILSAESKFEIVRHDCDRVQMVITGGVVGYKNKSEYVNELNRVLDGKAFITLMPSVNSEIDILVADDDSHSKYKKACNINTKAGYEKIKIGTSDEIKEYLLEKYN